MTIISWGYIQTNLYETSFLCIINWVFDHKFGLCRDKMSKFIFEMVQVQHQFTDCIYVWIEQRKNTSKKSKKTKNLATKVSLCLNMIRWSCFIDHIKFECKFTVMCVQVWHFEFRWKISGFLRCFWSWKGNRKAFLFKIKSKCMFFCLLILKILVLKEFSKILVWSLELITNSSDVKIMEMLKEIFSGEFFILHKIGGIIERKKSTVVYVFVCVRYTCNRSHNSSPCIITSQESTLFIREI